MSRCLLEIEIDYNTLDVQCRLPAQCFHKLTRYDLDGLAGTGIQILSMESEDDRDKLAHVVYHGKLTSEYQSDKLVMPSKIARLLGFFEGERVSVQLRSRGSFAAGRALEEAATVQLQVKSKFEWDLLSAAVVGRLEGELLQLVNIVHLGQRLCYPLSPSVALTLTVSHVESKDQPAASSASGSGSGQAREHSGWGAGGIFGQLRNLYGSESGAFATEAAVVRPRAHLISPRTTLVVSPPLVPLAAPGALSAADHPHPATLAAGAVDPVQAQAVASCVGDVRLIDVVDATRTQLALHAEFLLRLPDQPLKHSPNTVSKDQITTTTDCLNPAAEEDLLDAALDQLELEFLGGEKGTGAAPPVAASAGNSAPGAEKAAVAEYAVHPDSLLVPLMASFLSLSASSLRSCGLGSAVGTHQARLCEQRWVRAHLGGSTVSRESLWRHFRWCRIVRQEQEQERESIHLAEPVCICYSSAVPYRFVVPIAAGETCSGRSNSSPIKLQFLNAADAPSPSTSVSAFAPASLLTDSTRDLMASGTDDTSTLHGVDAEIDSLLAYIDGWRHCDTHCSQPNTADQSGRAMTSAVLLLGEKGSGKSSILTNLHLHCSSATDFTVVDCKALKIQPLSQVMSTLQAAFDRPIGAGADVGVIALDSLDELCPSLSRSGDGGSGGNVDGAVGAPMAHAELLRTNVLSHTIAHWIASNDVSANNALTIREQHRYYYSEHAYDYEPTREGSSACLSASLVSPIGTDGDDVGRVRNILRDRCATAQAAVRLIVITAATTETMHPALAVLFPPTGGRGGRAATVTATATAARWRHAVVQLPAVDAHPAPVLRRILQDRLSALRAVLHPNPADGHHDEPCAWLDALLQECTVCAIAELSRRSVCHALADGAEPDAQGNVRVRDEHVCRAAGDIAASNPSRAAASTLATATANISPKFRHASFGNVAGYKSTLHELSCVLIRPIRYSRLYALSPVKLPRNVLIYGPPGCGKSLLGHAVANEMGCNCLVVHGPELLNKFTGASERAVRELFSRARAAAPCLVLLDEFEALGGRRGQDNTGVTDRVVNQLLTFIDGAEDTMRGTKSGAQPGGGNVYIAALSSRPDMIDPALLRPGRIEKHVFVGLPDSADCMAILTALLEPIVAAATAVSSETTAAAVSTGGSAESAIDIGLYGWYAGEASELGAPSMAQFAPVCAEMAQLAAERRFTAADLEGVVKGAYADAIYGALQTQPQADRQQWVRPVLSPEKLLAAFHRASASLSDRDLQFYDAVYAQFGGNSLLNRDKSGSGAGLCFGQQKTTFM